MPPKQEDKLCVLITNNFIANRTGSELYVRDVAVELLRRGHRPVVYSPRLGELAREIRNATVPVVDDLGSLSVAPDLIHGQHHLETMTALSHFPGVPAVYFCHGWLPWEETPPRHPRILQYVANNDAVRDRLVYEHGIEGGRIVTLLNFVDLARFKPRPPLPAVPRRALIYSNQAAGDNYVRLVRDACARQGISVDVVGIGSGNPTRNPETLLGHYDIVFARGRAALEGMAVGAAVVCCDVEGLGPMVTTKNLGWLRRNNFGVRILNKPFDVELLWEEIRLYNSDDAAAVSRAIRSTASLSAAVDMVVEIYAATLTAWSETEPAEDAAEARAVSGYLKWMSQSVPHHLSSELRRMSAQYQRVSAESRAQREQVKRLETELDAVKKTAAWRVYQRVKSLAPVRGVSPRAVNPFKRWPGTRRAESAMPEATRPEGKRRVLALLQFHNEMRFLPDYFRNVAPQVDGIIALDDGSTDGSGEFVSNQSSVLQLVRLPPRSPHAWDEPRNRRLLTQAAWEHDPEWLIVVDADERLERDFSQRARTEIARAEREGHLAYRVKLLELWDNADTYRADGIWGHKRPPRFFKARRDHVFDDRPMHGLWAPLNSRPSGDYPVADLIVYHVRMISHSDRLARQARYKQLDPHNESQKMGYEYLTDVTGLILKKLPAGREYEPMQMPA